MQTIWKMDLFSNPHLPNWSVPASKVSDSGNCNSISFLLLPGKTHWLTSAKSSDIISSPTRASNSSPSSSASSNAMCEKTKFRPLMSDCPYEVPAAEIPCFSSVISYKSENVVLSLSKSVGGKPSKRNSWCNSFDPSVSILKYPKRPKTVHLAALIDFAGICLAIETSSSSLPNRADFQKTPDELAKVVARWKIRRFVRLFVAAYIQNNHYKKIFTCESSNWKTMKTNVFPNFLPGCHLRISTKELKIRR